MKMTVLLSLAVLSLAILLLVVRSRPQAAGLGPLQITLRVYTNNSDMTRVAEIIGTNTNSCSVWFRVFGPQIKGDDGAWPRLAHGLGKAQFVGAGASTQILVRPPPESVTWRIFVDCQRAPSAWERFRWWIRKVEWRLGLPQYPAPPSEEKETRRAVIEVRSEKTSQKYLQFPGLGVF